MTITVDINVLLDVFQKREPHYAASAQVVGLVTSQRLVGVFPAHGLIRNGIVRNYADLARLGGVSRARITQIMNLLNLPVIKQEEILFLTGDEVTEREMRGNLGQAASSLCCHSSALASQGREGNGVEAGAE